MPRGTQDLSSRPGIEPAPPALEAWSLNHWTTREVPQIIFLNPSDPKNPRGLLHFAFKSHENNPF